MRYHGTVARQVMFTSLRGRNGSFEPALIQKGQTRIDGMDDKIIGLYTAWY